jgi:hypothetical protein
MSDPDRFAVVDALTKAAIALGWRPSLAESHDWRVTIVILPPLARSRPERNRWPDEPEEGEEDHDVEWSTSVRDGSTRTMEVLGGTSELG